MEITFEKSKLEDVKKLLQIQNESFQEALTLHKDYVTNPAFESIEKIPYKIQKQYYYKIIVNGGIVGGIYIYKKEDHLYYLNRIFIRPKYENFGIGKMAMKFIENAKEGGNHYEL
ncbi:GNAT family N-acetyltransferase [Clostridium estertheticum]|uniref:GNAT family N-acetyltransferase n=1 Tax=Clostridium estertheticum TaxID=238834 RepID=UPI0013E96A93|nr:GNAT family N-acetyltransferase [Clostridium estertheticum]MBZ9687353.1 GNAT family N-acetyltransferase [Clostridium estertheticum]